VKTVHFVYAHGPDKSCPNAISNELTSRLEEANYRVSQYPWDQIGKIYPNQGDILLGHPHGLPFTYFRANVNHRAWSRRIILYPYAHGHLDYSAFIDLMVQHCDLFLAITGPYWFRRVPESRLGHWLPKMKHLDLAVNRAHFPFIKHAFNPPGSRRFVYIGSAGSHKNTGYLEQLAHHCPQMDFGWIGKGRDGPRGLRNHGYVDFQSEKGQTIVGDYDFLLTVGNSDPNPTTILESMAWGLVPVCTPQSGYEEPGGVINVPLNDVSTAAGVLRRLQQLPETELRALQIQNLHRLSSHYNWDRFASQVIQAIESDESPNLTHQSASNRMVIRANTWLWSERSSFLRPRVVKYFFTTAHRSLRDHIETRTNPPDEYRARQ